MRVAKIKDLNVNVWTKMWSNWSILKELVKNSFSLLKGPAYFL